jgi:hypothetical protein
MSNKIAIADVIDRIILAGGSLEITREEADEIMLYFVSENQLIPDLKGSLIFASGFEFTDIDITFICTLFRQRKENSQGENS